MLHASGLQKFLWGEALKHAVWFKNRTSTRALKGKTPYEMVYGMKPNIRDLHKFGTKVWVHDDRNSKLDGCSQVGRWLGFDTVSSGHRIYWPENGSISIERSVKFDELAEVFMQKPEGVQNEGENGKESIPPISQPQNLNFTTGNESATPHTLPTSLQSHPVTLTPAETSNKSAQPNYLGNLLQRKGLDPSNILEGKQTWKESKKLQHIRSGTGMSSSKPGDPKFMRGLQPAAGMTDSDQQRDTVGYVDFPDQWMEIAMFAAMAESEAIESSYEEAVRDVPNRQR